MLPDFTNTQGYWKGSLNRSIAEKDLNHLRPLKTFKDKQPIPRINLNSAFIVLLQAISHLGPVRPSHLSYPLLVDPFATFHRLFSYIWSPQLLLYHKLYHIFHTNASDQSLQKLDNIWDVWYSSKCAITI